MGGKLLPGDYQLQRWTGQPVHCVSWGTGKPEPSENMAGSNLSVLHNLRCAAVGLRRHRSRLR